MENQNVKWKSSWRDDYLKEICGFANAQGCRLEIGRNDKGVLIGLSNAKQLLEELPNKIRSDGELLKALKLTEGEYLLKAGALLFHQDPEQWCLGSYIKIGFFENDTDLRYQDEINGSLISIADSVMDTIYTKYLKGLIRYEGIQRIDEYPIPRDVLREAVLNAVVHKDYSRGNPIHIKVYDDKIVIYNDCRIPPNIEPESLLTGVLSIPYNPLIANVFFRSG